LEEKMSTEQIITLEHPVSVKLDGGGEASVSEVKIGKIRAKHLKLVPTTLLDGKSTNPAKLFPLIAAVTGLSESTLEELELSDFIAVVTAVTSQLGEGTAPEQNGGS
jgi:hypothetical protein